MTWKLILLAIIVLVCVVLFTSCYGTRKTLLFENRVYHWKVYYVKKSHFSVGTYSHFEVLFKDRKLILPKEVTDNKRAISEFVAATAIDNRSSQFGTVIVTFEGEFINDAGTPYRAFITLHLRPGKGDELVVTNPCTGKEAIITPGAN
ncbi:hypothetical protein HHL16_15770 [Pseudoflavitalea sp. G-6-1-2]|uniref:hypothetical protein n=1 Tax=Pseudoflavitalea sp. G-6-1-2 TaxID=2728841 RepID=UPI001469E164|nr:hypothetical protein [Pseudoflavitalea sp. G-6-1-2]NML22342.1 hypothetical protein [Pseudoflavitalea sp. G-6-1-2]